MDDVWATTRGRRAEQAILRRAAEGADPVLAEFANEVLSGRHTPRELARSSAYAEEFDQRMRPLFDRWQSMSEHERYDAITNADSYNRDVLAHFEAIGEPPVAEPRRPVRPSSEPDEEADYSERTYLVRGTPERPDR